MKNLIDGLVSMVFISIVSILLMSLVLTESKIIENRNSFFELYEEKLTNGETNVEISSEPFSLEIPFVGTIVDSYVFKGYIK